MYIKNLFLLLSFCVYSVVSVTPFINKGERAELFELTDNEVAVFKITLPDNEFNILKEKAIYAKDDDHFGFVKFVVELTKDIESFLTILPTINFKEYFPDYDLNKELPELNIDEEGFSNINTKKILDYLDLIVDHYNAEDSDVIEKILTSNPDFNLFKVVKTIGELKPVNDVKFDEAFTSLINTVKNGKTNSMKKRAEESDEVAAQFKTKNATMIAELNGKQDNFNKVTFSIGGSFSRQFSKLGYNIKICGGKNLYGRSHFKIRPDVNDPTFLRTKIVSDIHNRLGLATVSSNYVKLYINNEDMGLYTLNDAYKPSWIEFVFGEKDTKSLYKCDNLYDFSVNYVSGCTNEDDEVTDNSELIDFLNIVEKAETAADLENIFDIDLFLTEMALEYLLGAWDHIQNPFIGHNFYLYKTQNGIWKYLSFDFDHDLGIPFKKANSLFTTYTKNMHIIDILILKDSTRFEKILKDVVSKAFNPGDLYPHIDELKHFIKPHVEKDKVQNADGKYPGRINDSEPNIYTLEQWDANCEFTSIKNNYESFIIYGLKYWILLQYRYVCQHYNMECDATYLDRNYNYTINESLQFFYVCGFDQMDCETVYKGGDAPQINDDSTTTTTTTTTTASASTSIISLETESTNETSNNIKCLAELVNYSCCPENITKVYDHDEYGDWGYDFTKSEWCGLTPYESTSTSEENCWSEEFGYSCCKGCKVYVTDSNGSWGYESHHWCGIPLQCNN